MSTFSRRVLSEADCENFDRDGYLVVKGVVGEKQIAKTSEEIWQHLGMEPEITATWYDPQLRNRVGIDERGVIPFYHGESLWENRQNPRMYDVFHDLLKENHLLVSIDRVNMNPPVEDGWEYKGFMHFDVDTGIRPVPFELQGILSLTDCDADNGGFQCIPGFHNRIDEWLKSRPPGEDTRYPDFSEYESEHIGCEAGDLIVFDGRLPHGNSANRGKTPRLAQYITMWPADTPGFDLSARRACVTGKSAPKTRVNRLLPACPIGEDADASIVFSPLGERLAGLTPWQDESGLIEPQ